MKKFNVDQDKLPWPTYRNWTAESAYLSELMVKNKEVLLTGDS